MADIAVGLLPLEPKFMRVRVRARGDSTFLSHRFGEAARAAIRDKQAKVAKKGGRPKREPERDFHESIYWVDEGKTRCGIPAAAFKKAMVRAANDAGMKMTDARRWFFVRGCEDNPRLVAIEDAAPALREDTVTVGMGTDLRYRAEFSAWAATVEVEFDDTLISAEQLVNLLNRAGFSVGVGDWRPEKDGDHGRFEVVAA